MKKQIIMIAAYIALIGALCLAVKGKNESEQKWKTTAANVKAYDKLLSDSKDKNVAYQLTVDQLNSANDSVLKELNETRKKLGIKDKNVKSVQYVVSTFTKTDTLVMRDTLFKENVVQVDTVIGDQWYNTSLSFRQPSVIVLQPSFKSEKDIIVSYKKETVDPPKKCWLLRIFQKKHWVVNIDVVEKNPYVTGAKSKYVEIIK